MREVAITGLATVSPGGIGADALWERLLAGAPPPLAAGPARPGLALPAACAFGEELPAERWADPRRVRKASGATRLAVVAARLAVADASFPEDAELRAQTSVVLGTCFGSNGYYLKFHERVLERGPAAANAVLFTESVFNAPAGHVSMDHRLHGASLAVAGGEESGLSAVILAHDRLRLGAARAAIAGGVEEYADLVHASLLSEGRAARDAAGGLGPMPGPFAEGAAALVLEEAAAARARGVRVLATVRGAGRARPLLRDGEAAGARAAVRAARAACADAGIAPDDLDLVVAGGAGGRRSRVELAALAALFAEAPARERWLCAPQAQWGEGFAFASAALPVVAARALADGVIPPGCPGAVPPADWPAALGCAEGARPAPLERCLVLATSDPGAAAAVVLGRG